MEETTFDSLLAFGIPQAKVDELTKLNNEWLAAMVEPSGDGIDLEAIAKEKAAKEAFYKCYNALGLGDGATADDYLDPDAEAESQTVSNG